jgi:hypothetical protein
MTDTIEKIKVVNSSLRTAMVGILLTVVGYSGCLGYSQLIRPGQEAQKKLAALQEEFEVQKVALQESKKLAQKLQTSLKLLKVDRRLANVRVKTKGVDETTGQPYLDVDYWEVSQSGDVAVGNVRPFRLKGDKLYVDCWVVQFEDKYVENADALRNASLCVMKSIWGDLDGPNQGHSLDEEASGEIPVVYQSEHGVNEFEKKIWTDFWGVSNDPVKQKEMGIRASHGQVNYMKVEQGKTYQVEVRASGGASIRTLEN